MKVNYDEHNPLFKGPQWKEIYFSLIMDILGTGGMGQQVKALLVNKADKENLIPGTQTL